jgi:hypothetical protein
LTRLTDVLCASGMPPAKDRHLIMIKYPVLAITSAGFCCSQGFPQIGAKGRNFHTDARRLRSVASRSAASVQPRPTLGFRCGRRGFVVFRGTTLGTEGVLTTQRGSIGVGLIGQAVGLFAPTNIDDDLDRQTADHHEHKFYE